MPLTSSQVGALDNFGEAIRRLRSQRGLASQAELAARSGVAITTVNKIETGKRRPDFDTAGALLDAMNCTLHDLAAALDEAAGRAPADRKGKPRPDWVAGLVVRGVDRDSLWGFAVAALSSGDAAALGDLVASAEEAAREMATQTLDDAAKIRHPVAMVAEGAADYGADRKRKKR